MTMLILMLLVAKHLQTKFFFSPTQITLVTVDIQLLIHVQTAIRFTT